MPYRWVEPCLFHRYKDINVYHSYKDFFEENINFFNFTTSLLEDEEFEFDVRDFLSVVPDTVKSLFDISNLYSDGNIEACKKIIEWAIDHHKLSLSGDQEYTHERVSEGINYDVREAISKILPMGE